MLLGSRSVDRTNVTRKKAPQRKITPLQCKKVLCYNLIHDMKKLCIKTMLCVIIIS